MSRLEELGRAIVEAAKVADEPPVNETEIRLLEQHARKEEAQVTALGLRTPKPETVLGDSDPGTGAVPRAESSGYEQEGAATDGGQAPPEVEDQAATQGQRERLMQIFRGANS